MNIDYPQYVVDMMYDYLKADQGDVYDPNKLEQMLDMIEFEVELYEIVTDLDNLEERNTGWYADLVRQVQQTYDYVPETV
jgi:hypothetical protein